ncbi:MAG: prepilin-type N-terminal cleavage/methylation domain-containing protein [bacterium]
MPHKQKSFTLIEMLIVVVIIGILAAALIPRLQSVQARARDTKRKADLHQIATALEIYKEDNGSYDGISDSPTDIGIYNWRPGNQRAITSLSNYANFYSVTDRSDTAFRVYNILEKYMTSIPTDASNTSWKIRRKDIMGYAATTMNNTIPSLSQYATHN